MKQKSEFIIDELKKHLTLQLEAYQNQDKTLYDELEEKILDLEQKL